jgi:hypothetical protein
MNQETLKVRLTADFVTALLRQCYGFVTATKCKIVNVCRLCNDVTAPAPQKDERHPCARRLGFIRLPPPSDLAAGHFTLFHQIALYFEVQCLKYPARLPSIQSISKRLKLAQYPPPDIS